jgi:hypothetical protein
MANDPHSTETPAQPAPKRSAAANTFIVVGFLLLIFLGIGIAIYSSRYVPAAVNTFSVANPVTGLPASNNDNSQAQLAVEPGTSVPFSTSQTIATTTVMQPSNGMTDGASTETPFPTTGSMYSTLSNGYQATASAYNATAPAPATSYASASYYGLPDLSTHIVAVGYLANSSNSSFVAAPVIPIGARAAVEFTIGSVGTAPTGPWAFAAEIPTDNGYNFQSPVEASMNPGDHVLFTLAFDQVPPGPAEMITIIADPNNYIQEVTKTNNTAQTSVSVVGS